MKRPGRSRFCSAMGETTAIHIRCMGLAAHYYSTTRSVPAVAADRPCTPCMSRTWLHDVQGRSHLVSLNPPSNGAATIGR